MPKIVPIVLCGGTGTRLWPASRRNKPKQFLSLTNDLTLLENTLARVKPLGDPVLLSNKTFLPYLPGGYQVIVEPSGRDTGPACIATALCFSPDDLLLFVPSDHHLVEDDLFRKEVLAAVPKVEAGKIVLFGLVPTRPETGFGYIRYRDDFTVESFVEKPSVTVAEELISQKSLWNAGLLFFRVKEFLVNCELVCPEYLAQCRLSVQDGQLTKEYNDLPKISIDYLFNQKCKEMMVHPLPCTWSDIGSWPAVWELQKKDDQGNAGEGIFLDSRNNLVRSKKQVVMVGVSNLVVMEDGQDLLIMTMDQAQRLKDLGKILDEGRL